MYSSHPKLPEGINLEHKIKALEINSQQFYSQLKPLFNENTQLKQHIISINFYIEERKIQLCKLIADIGPNGEDRVLMKAVADLKQICDLLEEEHFRLNNSLNEHKNYQFLQQKELTDLRELLHATTEKHLLEKQQFVDQNRRQSEFYRAQLDNMNQKLNQQQMRAEDLQSQIMELKNSEKDLRIKYRKEQEQAVAQVRDELNQLNLLKLQMQETFDHERRTYLKQLEMQAIKLKQLREEVTDEYESKIGNLRYKLEGQLSNLKQDHTNLKHQLSIQLEQNKNQQVQIDRYNNFIGQLEKENQDQSLRIQLLEEQIKVKEHKVAQLMNLNESQKEQLERSKIEIKKLNEAMKGDMKRSSVFGNKQQNQDKGKLWKQAAALIKREPYSKVIQPQPQQFKDYTKPEEESDAKQRQQFTQEVVSTTMLEEQQQADAHEQLENQDSFIQEAESSSPGTFIKSPGKQSVVLQFTLNDTRILTQDQEVQTHTQPHSPTQIQRLSSSEEKRYAQIIAELRQQIALQDQILGEGIQKYEEKIALLNQQLREKELNYQKELGELNRSLQERLEESEALMHQRLAEQREELDDQTKILVDQKDREIKALTQRSQELMDRVDGLEKNVQQYEELQEEIHTLYEGKLKEKDQEILQLKEEIMLLTQKVNQFQGTISSLQNEGEKEQSRLLGLGQEIKQEYQTQIENLLNQHAIDQEIIKQEQLKLQQERQGNLQFKAEAEALIRQVKSKEELLDSYRQELMKSTEIVKYLQLELENYKKLNNIFRPRQQNEAPQIGVGYNGLGFLPMELQDRLKSKMKNSKHKDLREGSQMTQQKQGSKIVKGKGGKNSMLESKASVQLNEVRSSIGIQQLNRTEPDIDMGLPRVSTKRMKLELGEGKNRNLRSKTQVSDGEQTDLVQDISKKEEQLLKHSQQLMFQLNPNGINLKQLVRIPKRNHRV